MQEWKQEPYLTIEKARERWRFYSKGYRAGMRRRRRMMSKVFWGGVIIGELAQIAVYFLAK